MSNANTHLKYTNKPFVALLHCHESSSSTIPTRIVSLTDPCTGTQRQYLTTTTTTTATGSNTTTNNNSNTSTTTSSSPTTATETAPSKIYEVQSIPRTTTSESYSSFFVNSRVVSNPHMHLVTAVDPLYFILLYFEREEKWQPWDQLVTTKNIPMNLIQALDVKQLGHLFSINNSLGDDLLLYKLDKDRTLTWLQRKMDRISSFLENQLLSLLRRENANQSQDKILHSENQDDDTGAFCTSFYLPPPPPTTAAAASDVHPDPVKVSPEIDHIANTVDRNHNEHNHDDDDDDDDDAIDIISSTDKLFVKQSAVQILCEYLPPFWQTEFLKSQGMTIKDLSILMKSKTTHKKDTDAALDHVNVNVSETMTTISTPMTEDSAVVSKSSSSSSSNIPSTHMSEIEKLYQYTMGNGNGGEGPSSSSSLSSSKKRKETEQSVGLKKLSKVNTKGMKTMTSFFNVVAKPKKKEVKK